MWTTYLLLVTTCVCLASTYPLNPEVDARFCDPSLTSPFYTGYRLRASITLSPSQVKVVSTHLDYCSDGKLVSSVPFQLAENHKNHWFPWAKFPFSKSICSGITCFKIGRTREGVLRDDTALQLTPGQFLGGLFYVAEGDGSHDEQLEPVAPFMREDISQVFVSARKDDANKIEKQIHVPLLYSPEDIRVSYVDGEPWYSRVSGNENYQIAEETRSLYNALFDQVLMTLKRYLKVYNKKFQKLQSNISDEKPVRKAMKSVTVDKLSRLDTVTVSLLKEKIDNLAKHRLNTHFLDYETLFTMFKVIPRAEMKRFVRQLDAIYLKIPINPLLQPLINYKYGAKPDAVTTF